MEWKRANMSMSTGTDLYRYLFLIKCDVNDVSIRVMLYIMPTIANAKKMQIRVINRLIGKSLKE